MPAIHEAKKNDKFCGIRGGRGCRNFWNVYHKFGVDTARERNVGKSEEWHLSMFGSRDGIISLIVPNQFLSCLFYFPSGSRRVILGQRYVARQQAQLHDARR